MDKQKILPSGIGEFISLLTISSLAFIIPIVLFTWRSLDNNSLTPWRWVFANIDPGSLLFLLIPVIILAYILSRLSFYENRPLVLFISSFAAAIIFWPAPEVIMDAARYFTQAKHLELYGAGYFLKEWGGAISAWTDLPLVPFLYGLSFKYLGESRMVVQGLGAFFFAGTVFLTYLTGTLFWNKQIGFFGALLLLGFPYLFTQLPLMMVDVPTMFFLMLAIYAFARALEIGGAASLAMAAAALFMAFFVKYSTWPLLTVLPVIFIYYLRLNPRAVAKRGAIVAAAAALGIGMALALHYDVVVEQIRLLISFQRPALTRWGETFTSTFLFQIHPFVSLAAAFSLYVAIRKKDLRYVIVIYPIVLILFVLQVKRIRYLLPVFPLLALMAAYGLNEIRNNGIKKYIVFCCIGSSLVLAVFGYLPFLQKLSAVNLQQAGSFLNSLDIDSVEVLAVPSRKQPANPAIAVQLLDLFTDTPILYLDPVLPATRLQHRESSLRFTWEQKNPVYYGAEETMEQERKAIAIVSSLPGQRLPVDLKSRITGYRFSKRFTTATNLFKHQTLVTVYYN